MKQTTSKKEILIYLIIFFVLIFILLLQVYKPFTDGKAGISQANALSHTSATGMMAEDAVTVDPEMETPSENQKGEKPGKLKRIVKAVRDRVSLGNADKQKELHWGYKGKLGPSHWASLSPKYKKCAAGRTQSPVDLKNPPSDQGNNLPYWGPELEFYYQPVDVFIGLKDNILFTPITSGNFLRVSGVDYKLKNIHFRTPSEHRLNGRHYPLEIQMLHEGAGGRILIVSIFAQEGGPHFLLDAMPVPEVAGTGETLNGMQFDPGLLLPVNRSYLAFDGSLTMPPCTENIGWAVLTTPIFVSPQRLKRLRTVMGANNRPVQPLNGRPVVAVNR